MSDNILVIGNGFDLMHGRKTKYAHFLGFLKQLSADRTSLSDEIVQGAERCFPTYMRSDLIRYFISLYDKNIKKGNWIDLEYDMKALIKALIEFVDEESGNNTRHGRVEYRYRFSSIPYRTSRLLRTLKCFNLSQVGDEFILKSEFVDTWGFINIDKIISELVKELEGVIKLLEYYLMIVEPSDRDFDLKKIRFIEEIDPSYVISFNYTDTFEKLYGTCDEGVSYIHGKLGKGNMVLGYNDDDSNDDIAFKKYYQRLINNTDNINSLMKEENGVYTSRPIVFIGHSLDISDEDILRELLYGDNSVSIYYKDDTDKNKKIANVIKLLGKEKALSKIKENIISFEIIPDNH